MPAECAVRSRTEARVPLTPRLWNELVAVNAQVNLSIIPATDEEVYGRPEYWAYPVDRGDCEDLVLLEAPRPDQEGMARRAPC